MLWVYSCGTETIWPHRVARTQPRISGILGLWDSDMKLKMAVTVGHWNVLDNNIECWHINYKKYSSSQIYTQITPDSTNAAYEGGTSSHSPTGRECYRDLLFACNVCRKLKHVSIIIGCWNSHGSVYLPC